MQELKNMVSERLLSDRTKNFKVVYFAEYMFFPLLERRYIMQIWHYKTWFIGVCLVSWPAHYSNSHYSSACCYDSVVVREEKLFSSVLCQMWRSEVNLGFIFVMIPLLCTLLHFSLFISTFTLLSALRAFFAPASPHLSLFGLPLRSVPILNSSKSKWV